MIEKEAENKTSQIPPYSIKADIVSIDLNKKYAVVVPEDSGINPEDVAMQITEWVNDENMPFLILHGGMKLVRIKTGSGHEPEEKD